MKSDEVSAEQYIQKLLGIPGHFKVLSIITIGYPEASRKGKAYDELQFEKIRVNGF